MRWLALAALCLPACYDFSHVGYGAGDGSAVAPDSAETSFDRPLLSDISAAKLEGGSLDLTGSDLPPGADLLVAPPSDGPPADLTAMSFNPDLTVPIANNADQTGASNPDLAVSNNPDLVVSNNPDLTPSGGHPDLAAAPPDAAAARDAASQSDLSSPDLLLPPDLSTCFVGTSWCGGSCVVCLTSCSGKSHACNKGPSTCVANCATDCAGGNCF